MNQNEIIILFFYKQNWEFLPYCLLVFLQWVCHGALSPARSVPDTCMTVNLTNCDFGQSKQELLKPVEQENKSTKRNETHTACAPVYCHVMFKQVLTTRAGRIWRLNWWKNTIFMNVIRGLSGLNIIGFINIMTLISPIVFSFRDSKVLLSLCLTQQNSVSDISSWWLKNYKNPHCNIIDNT